MPDISPVLLITGWLLSNLAAAVGGVGLWQYLARREDRRHERADRLDAQTRADLAAERTAHRECLVRLADVERRLEVVEHHHSSLFARWIKDAGKRISWVNGRAMASIFGPLGLTRDQVEGRTFQDLLDPESSSEIDRLDEEALLNPGTPVWTVVQLHRQLPVMIVCKVAGVGRDQELIYEGHAYPMSDSLEKSGAPGRRGVAQLHLSQLRQGGPEAVQD